MAQNKIYATRTKKTIMPTSRTPVSRGYLDQAIASKSSGGKIMRKDLVKPISSTKKRGGGGR